jgi:hypothetical protein
LGRSRTALPAITPHEPDLPGLTRRRAELAAEIMWVAFHDRSDCDMSIKELIEWLLFPESPESNARDVKRVVGSTDELQWAVWEALQLLEHSELVVTAPIDVTGFDHKHRWRATRLGSVTMDCGKDVVRRRIKDRTGL